jgi:predicted nucleic acid-binding protein
VEGDQGDEGGPVKPAYVVDSSVFASIMVKDEFYGRALDFVRRFQGKVATVDLAVVEVANALWKHVYLARRIREDAYAALKGAIKPLIYSTASVFRADELLEDALDGAVRLGITVYDSLYVTLALREGCKLATFDEKLRAQLAAKGLDVAVPP